MIYREAKKKKMLVQSVFQKNIFGKSEGRNPKEKQKHLVFFALAGGSLGPEFSRAQWLVAGRSLLY